jgi:hypothetical protein
MTYNKHYRRRVTFQYMGRYWSMDKIRFMALQAVIEDGQPFDIVDRGGRELARKPRVLDWLKLI